MTTPFASVRDRANAAVLRHLANAMATVGDATVPVLFAATHVTPFGGEVDASISSCEGAVADLGELQRGARMVINGDTYQVLESGVAESGLWRLVLGGV